MKLHRTILLLVLLINGFVHAQNKAALVIGIGAYPKESGWCAIHGDNDISIVVEMLEHNDFGKDNIQILKNDEATKQAIMQALGGLIQIANEVMWFISTFRDTGSRLRTWMATSPTIMMKHGFRMMLARNTTPTVTLGKTMLSTMNYLTY